MKIGILGGTFDPIHNGHVSIAEKSLSQFCLDCIWFMPAGKPYFKSKKTVSDPGIRLEMVKLCVSELSDKFLVSDFEIKKNGNTYTADTLEELREKFPENEYYFILGEDSVSALDTWYKPETILKNAVILAACRKSSDNIKSLTDKIFYLKNKYAYYKPDIRLIDCDYIDISSTMIRKMISQGLDCSEIISKKVYDYIKQKRLYLS